MRVEKTFTYIMWFVYSFLFVETICSCGSSKQIENNYNYFKNGKDTVSVLQKETVIQANDLLSVQVYSKMQNQEQAVIFNIPPSSNNLAQGYQVNTAGNIEMPIIGSVKVAGLNKTQLQNLLEQKLNSYVKSPSVIVRFLEFTINVLGEVRAPGSHKFNMDRVSLIDALSAAGDLTDYGRREDVTVIREENGKMIYYLIDLRSKTLFESNVYMLQPNDIVYVSPNRFKLKALNADPDVQRRTQLILSVSSFLLGVASFLIYTLR